MTSLESKPPSLLDPDLSAFLSPVRTASNFAEAEGPAIGTLAEIPVLGPWQRMIFFEKPTL